MKKILLGLVLVIVLIIALAMYYVFSNLDSLVKAAIEQYGSQATQTEVQVESVKIHLGDGAAAINGLSIANPKGFAMPKAFSLGEISTRIDLESLQEEPYIIDEITVRAPQVFVEINKDKQTNLNELKKNLMAASGKQTTATSETKTDKSTAKEPRLIIRRINFVEGNIQAKVVPLKNKEYQLKLPALKLRNLGGDKGVPASQLASEIISQLSDHARNEIKKKGIDRELDKLKAKAKAKIEEEKAKLKQKADSKLEEEKEKAVDKLKDLFNR